MLVHHLLRLARNSSRSHPQTDSCEITWTNHMVVSLFPAPWAWRSSRLEHDQFHEFTIIVLSVRSTNSTTQGLIYDRSLECNPLYFTFISPQIPHVKSDCRSCLMHHHHIDRRQSMNTIRQIQSDWTFPYPSQGTPLCRGVPVAWELGRMAICGVHSSVLSLHASRSFGLTTPWSGTNHCNRESGTTKSDGMTLF
ncbi:hypothetical protein P152DRAFT_176609 [Eremomyces bilateralis CBS 781.70]|uniref:Uncharacterized protein n=1 Tax=Eremomyces bilateralis CBS 781.70 TaxID=1392243 RepID=A0A6G1FTE6_9PEZI|nr:uncharacterized protein P152DRAFT_176609 [Eremomyces bilateralis CBS 781.70]KAF1808931.1 hypothetical protein P152DRAFT_176609 [Eremomyces bilateralis CBS 781.70]